MEPPCTPLLRIPWRPARLAVHTKPESPHARRLQSAKFQMDASQHILGTTRINNTARYVALGPASKTSASLVTGLHQTLKKHQDISALLPSTWAKVVAMCLDRPTCRIPRYHGCKRGHGWDQCRGTTRVEIRDDSSSGRRVWIVGVHLVLRLVATAAVTRTGKAYVWISWRMVRAVGIRFIEDRWGGQTGKSDGAKAGNRIGCLGLIDGYF